MLTGGQPMEHAPEWHLKGWHMIWACKLGGSCPSLLWFRAPGGNRLGDNGKKNLLLCLLCSLQTSLHSVGPWLIPTAISKRRHKMSSLFSWQGWKTKESQGPHSLKPISDLGGTDTKYCYQNAFTGDGLSQYRCFRKAVGGLACWTLRMSNFYLEIKVRWTEISRCKPWMRELAHQHDCVAEDLGSSPCSGMSPGTSLRERHGRPIVPFTWLTPDWLTFCSHQLLTNRTVSY